MLVFQFPTGWNSTFDSDYFVGIGVVSIPNGMEFYGFYRYFEPDWYFVSIPNGMEFYAVAAIRFAPSTRFNSQRDGILRYLMFF